MSVPKETKTMIQPKKRVTLRDLAKELGLSDRAVSQALSPRESNVKLNPKTVERIQELAALRNYRRDSRARSMRYGRFYNIGYFEAKKKTTGWPLLGAESGVCDAGIEHGYHILLIRLPSDLAADQTSIPSIFHESNLDALILSHAGNLTEDLEKIIDASGFPVVYLNEKKSHNAVYVDDLRGAEEITAHMISQGNRQIALYGVDQALAHYSAIDRTKGYEKAMKKARLEPLLVPSNSRDQREFDQWMEAHQGLEAIVCYNDLAALHLFRLTYNSAYRAPTNLAVAGYGDDFARDCCPVGLTTMRIPFYEMGKAAVEMALELVNGDQEQIPSRIFSPELMVRDSTRGRLAQKAPSQ